MKVRLPTLVVVALSLCASVKPAHAGWEENLREDARMEIGCEVSFLSHVVVRTFRGRRIVNAKVHCEDQRTFDAQREGEGESFTFRECVDSNAREC